ncbi:restriction endonuclease [Alteribacillus sp. YIM 98480]|uniref:restriction endonuclease n=1 Tax=Alteribacillus sp. YIM 98480 TaxID=2606599 RepID=UPI00131CB5BD|nr:restriction endonuclease [Alteribacillus sp. YIM 98480]
MYLIETSEYPNIREWDTKVFSMPKIPRSSNGYPESLKVILTALKENKPYTKPIEIEGSNRKDTLDRLFVFLRPTGIVKKRLNGNWEMSDEISKWLDSGDNLYLAAILNANIRFFSEILHILSKNSAQIQEIREIAKNDYKLPWKEKSEIHNRLGWLRDLELVTYEDFSYTYSITELGKKFLSLVGYFNHENIEVELDSTVNEAEVPISKWALELCDLSAEEKLQRKNGLGYLPGNVHVMHETVYDYLLLMANPTDITKINNYSNETYGIKDSSVNSLLTTLSNLDFIERKTKTQYQTTSLGNKFPTDNFELDFACCVNRKFNFVFEILAELFQEELSLKELSTRGKVSYNFSYQDHTELRKRLHILKAAKLIQEIGTELYGLTIRGYNFYELIKEHVSLNTIEKSQTDSSKIEYENSSYVDNCLNELELASKDSSNPERFEKALEVAFRLLGFKVEHLGGAGKTDILLNAPTAPKFAYSVTVDAKSTYHSVISESSIDFDTIVEHKNKHGANYAVIVGIKFQGKRLIDRAKNREVALIDVDSLEKLIRHHVKVPLKSDSYKKILEQSGLVDLKVLEEDRKKITREGLLLRAIIECLSEQSSDPFTKGIVQAREIYLLLKNNQQFDNPPDLNEVQFMLEFLSSPLISVVGAAKEGYYALGSIEDAAQKFDFYLKACKRSNNIKG